MEHVVAGGKPLRGERRGKSAICCCLQRYWSNRLQRRTSATKLRRQRKRGIKSCISIFKSKMGVCVVPTCNHRTDKKLKSTAKITFHRFPKDLKRRTLWINILNLDNSKISSHTLICSEHFKKEDIDTSSLTTVRLKPNALPTKHVHDKVQSSDTSAISSDFLTNVDEITTPHVSEIQEVTDTLSSMDSSTSLETHVPLTQEKGTTIDFAFIYNSPEKTRLRNRLKYLSHQYHTKIRKLQQSIRRKSNYIETLTNALDEMKKQRLLNDEQVEILQNLGGPVNQIFKRQLNRKLSLSQHRQYEPELRAFALTLHYYSPRAYEYVREIFNHCLPHVKTLSKWYGSMDGKPGICVEALNSIKQRADSVEYNLIGALIFDEMAIRQHLEYDGINYSGYVDMGNIACDDTMLAKEALVFMVVCVNSGWKIPIAYYLVNGVTAEQKCNLVLQCISALHDVKMKIVSVTCDGTSICQYLYANYII